jgi:hypothetical protein
MLLFDTAIPFSATLAWLVASEALQVVLLIARLFKETSEKISACRKRIGEK